MAELKNRIDFVYLFDVQDGNPNGDPDAANLPRVDAETMHGIVTDVCLKRKVRNYVTVSKNLQKGYNMFIREKAVLDTVVENTYDEDDIKAIKDKEEQKKAAKKRLCENYFDVRTFGAVIATSGKTDQVRGAIQFTFARSIDSIVPRSMSITRMAVSSEDEAKKQSGDNRTMGRKSTVPYGLYLCHGFISANLAKQTGFDEDDLDLFWDALKNMFDVDRSAARGLMSAQKLIVFKHDSELGNAPANKLFDLVKVEKKDESKVARSFADYSVEIDKVNVPANVEVVEMI